MYRLESTRLILRPLTWDDFNFLNRIHSDQDVARFIGNGRPRSEAESRNWLEKTSHFYETEELGQLAVTLKSNNMIIGRCGLSPFEVEIIYGNSFRMSKTPVQCFWGYGSAPDGIRTLRAVELGYAFAKEFWGHGYATEAACIMRDYAFFNRKEKQIMSLIFPENIASIKVATKVGLKFADKVLFQGNLLDRYIITKTEWKRLITKLK